MALLLPLQPIGLGASEVECFSSYFDRLAHLHGYTRTSLIQSMMRAYGTDHHSESLTSSGQVASRDLHRSCSSLLQCWPDQSPRHPIEVGIRNPRD